MPTVQILRFNPDFHEKRERERVITVKRVVRRRFHGRLSRGYPLDVLLSIFESAFIYIVQLKKRLTRFLAPMQVVRGIRDLRRLCS